MLRLTSRIRRFVSNFGNEYNAGFNKGHRTSDPSVQLTISLARSDSVLEIAQKANSQEAELSHKTFALRNIARILKTNPSSRAEARNPDYVQITQEILQSIPLLKPQEISDVCFWGRVAKNAGMFHLRRESIKKLIEAINSKIAEGEFVSSKQLISIKHDLSVIGITVPLLDRELVKLMSDKNQIFSLSDFKMVLKSSKNNREIIEFAISRILEVSEDRIDAESALRILEELVTSQDPKSYSRIDRAKSKYLRALMNSKDSFSESEITKLVEIAPNDLDLLKNLLQLSVSKVAYNLEINPDIYSDSFFGRMSSGLVGLSNSNFNLSNRFYNSFYNEICERIRKGSLKPDLVIKISNNISELPRVHQELKEEIKHFFERQKPIDDLKLVKMIEISTKFRTEIPITNYYKTLDEAFESFKNRPIFRIPPLLESLALSSKLSSNPEYREIFQKLLEQ